MSSYCSSNRAGDGAADAEEKWSKGAPVEGWSVAARLGCGTLEQVHNSPPLLWSHHGALIHTPSATLPNALRGIFS